MSKGMIKVFLFYQRLARKEKLLLLLAGSQALGERCRSRKGSARAGTIPADGDGAGRCALLRPERGSPRAQPQRLGSGSPAGARRGEAGTQTRLSASEDDLGGT